MVLNLFKLRPSLDITHLKFNYLINVNLLNNRAFIPINQQYVPVKNNLKYLPGNNIAASTRWLEEGINLDLDRMDYLRETDPSTTFNRYRVGNVTAYSHKINLYSGFKSNNLFIIGRTDNLTGEVILKEEMFFHQEN